ARDRLLLGRAGDVPRLRPDQQPVTGAERTRPLRREPERVGGHALQPRQVLARAVGRDRAERLVVELARAPGADRRASPLRAAEVQAQGAQADARVVRLLRRAVLAVLVVVLAAQ